MKPLEDVIQEKMTQQSKKNPAAPDSSPTPPASHGHSTPDAATAALSKKPSPQEVQKTRESLRAKIKARIEAAKKKAKDTHRPKDGPHEVKDKQGNVIQRMVFKDGKLNGPFETYKNNHLLQQLTFVDGILNGPAAAYDHHSFEKVSDTNYVDNKLEGNGVFYRRGDKVMEAVFKNNKQNGQTTIYGHGGKISAQIMFVDGQMEGPAHFFDATGHVSRTCTYAKGQLNGLCKTYYPTGDLLESSFYKDGKLEGASIQYYENGQKRQVAMYKDGKLVQPPETYGFLGGKTTKGSKIPCSPEEALRMVSEKE